MAPHRDATLEPEQEVLPNRLDSVEPAPVDRGGYPGHKPAWMRRAGGEPEPDERTKPRGRAMEGVALRHRRKKQRWGVSPGVWETPATPIYE
jgi:hypothetical protein